MAGIAGCFHLDGAPATPGEGAIVSAMSAAIAHRGLGTRTILRQGPLAMVTRGVGNLAFDGRARDAASRWTRRAAACLPELHGPFALAAWDGHTLTLARDRVGAAPLYLAHVGPLLLFASELKALFVHPSCPRAVDWVGVLADEAMPGRRLPSTTGFLGIDAFEPGTAHAYGPNGRATWRWASIELREDPEDSRTEAELIDGYRAVLHDAVRDATQDEAGILLSGGIDSISVAALSGCSMDAFTVVGQSTVGNGDARLAHAAAEALGLREHPVLFPRGERISADEWRRLLWLSESAECSAQHYYKLHLHLKAAALCPDLDVMLTGEGSDEYSGADFANHGEDRPDAGWEDYLGHLREFQRIDLLDLDTLAIERSMGRSVFTRDVLGASSGRARFGHPWERRFALVGPAVADGVLGRDNRLAAAVGLRSEAPFLDHRVIEFVAAIPRRAWGALYWKKRMLREAMRGIVPEALREVPKIPFFAGRDARYTSALLYDVLAADDHALVREALGEGAHPVLADGLVHTLIAECDRDPERRLAWMLLRLVNLGLLEQMAADAARRPGPASEIEPHETIAIGDEAAAAVGEVQIGPDAVLALAPGVELVRPDNDDPARPTYILVDEALRYVLDEPETLPWRGVLRQLDGQRPLSSFDVPFDAIALHAEEALRFGVVTQALSC